MFFNAAFLHDIVLCGKINIPALFYGMLKKKRVKTCGVYCLVKLSK